MAKQLNHKDRELLVQRAADETEKVCRQRRIKCWNTSRSAYTPEAQEIFNEAYDHFEDIAAAEKEGAVTALRGVFIGGMDFANYRVVAAGLDKTSVKEAIRRSVTSSVYWKDSEWKGRPWDEAWSYFSGSIEFVKFGEAEWQ